MNYIKQLQQENKALKENIQSASQEITDTLKYLSLDKFQGTENNFVNASEMRSRFLEIRKTLMF